MVPDVCMPYVHTTVPPAPCRVVSARPQRNLPMRLKDAIRKMAGRKLYLEQDPYSKTRARPSRAPRQEYCWILFDLCVGQQMQPVGEHGKTEGVDDPNASGFLGGSCVKLCITNLVARNVRWVSGKSHKLVSCFMHTHTKPPMAGHNWMTGWERPQLSATSAFDKLSCIKSHERDQRAIGMFKGSYQQLRALLRHSKIASTAWHFDTARGKKQNLGLRAKLGPLHPMWDATYCEYQSGTQDTENDRPQRTLSR